MLPAEKSGLPRFIVNPKTDTGVLRARRFELQYVGREFARIVDCQHVGAGLLSAEYGITLRKSITAGTTGGTTGKTCMWRTSLRRGSHACRSSSSRSAGDLLLMNPVTLFQTMLRSTSA